MAPPTLTHSKLFSLDTLFLSFSPSPFLILSSFFFSFSIFFFFFCNLGLIMGGDFGFDFGQISLLLWAMILGRFSVVASYSSLSSSSSFAIWVWFWTDFSAVVGNDFGQILSCCFLFFIFFFFFFCNLGLIIYMGLMIFFFFFFEERFW